MEDAKLVKKMISYFTETKLIDQFKDAFLEVIETDEVFQKRFSQILEYGNKPTHETLWKKIIDTEDDILSDEIKVKIFNRFNEILQKIIGTPD